MGIAERSTLLSFILVVLTPLPLSAQEATSDVSRWERRAENVTITRDDWGIPHVHGRTDADAVFGLIYAQAEDGFERIETNYLNALGRLAEAEGESAIFRDLRTRLFIDPDTLKGRYRESPPWLQAVMDAWADGLNYYLHTHPEVTPRVIRRFEPWMSLAFSEGSITNDVTRIPPGQVQSFYGNDPAPPPTETERSKDHDGSNAIAIAPSKTAAGNALLLINPHTSFYFRTEAHVSSEEGLNAYGAATWGQFFLFHGFNDRLGWAHTTSGVDAVDEYLESVIERDGQLHYRYGAEERPVATSTVTLAYRTPGGDMADRTFTVYRTHRGPIIREENGWWVSIALMWKPVEALRQSFLRMKARDLGSFMAALELKANSTNNTMYADADGNIAFQPPQFIPRRDDRFDFRRPVDGTDPATDWHGAHALDEAPRLLNPASGWIQNTNNWPYSAAGPYSPRREDYPRYMDTFGENPRGVHAVMLLRDRTGFTLDGVGEVAYDSYQPGFAQVIPSLIAAHEKIPESHALKRRLREQVELLRGWDYRWGVGSVAMSLGMSWANNLWLEFVSDRVPDADHRSELELNGYLAERTTTEEKLEVLATVSDRLEKDFGTWRTPWGEINRFQRLIGQPEQSFMDESPSIPIGFSEAWTGSLATFYTTTPTGAKRRYGIGGNTFVAVVEFGDRVRARAIRPGGQSGDPASPHFDDQSIRYAAGHLRDVYFYRSDLEGHIEREYHPGRFETQRPDTVHVAPPTGKKKTDRANILAALEEVKPGGTVQFAPGTTLQTPPEASHGQDARGTRAPISRLAAGDGHAQSGRYSGPIIDVHLHGGMISAWGVEPPVGICAPFAHFRTWDPAQPYEEFFREQYLKGPPCPEPVWSPDSDAEVIRQTIDAMEQYNMIGVVSSSPDRVASWRAEAPERIIPGLYFNLGSENSVSPDSLRSLVATGAVEVFGEIANAYAGIAPDDPRMEPYWALAEELDIPVAIHVGGGPPGEPYAGHGYRALLESALTMEEVLVRHPRLRVYLMHAGYPMLDDLLAVLSLHPQVYVDVGAIVYSLPREEFYRYLRGIVQAGFGQRVMFGSDQMIWPQTIVRSIEVIEEAPFLSPEQKADIFYNNAARFLRLGDEIIARHHAMASQTGRER